MLNTAARISTRGAACLLKPIGCVGSDELFLTAAHVVQAATSVGDVALGQLTVAVGDSRYDVATDWEVFEGIDVAVTGHERGRRLSRNEGLRERFL